MDKHACYVFLYVHFCSTLGDAVIYSMKIMYFYYIEINFKIEFEMEQKS